MIVIHSPLQGAAAYDCEQGCRLDQGSKVCGFDGNTYANECLAVCQGTEVRNKGDCPGSAASPSFDSEGEISMEEAGRYSPGFKATGKRTAYATPDPEALARVQAVTQEAQKTSTFDSKVVMLTSDGIEYVGDSFASIAGEAALSSDGQNEAPPSHGEDAPRTADNDDTAEKIIGFDNRFQVSTSLVTTFPYRVIGQMTVPLFGQQQLSWCTGTVISRNHVLTNGHCVYDQIGQEWYPLGQFVPARVGSSRPYGTWNVTTYRTYAAFTGGDRSGEYDIALLEINPRSSDGKSIGDVVGYAGLRRTEFGMPSLQQSRVTGYPQDKNDEMWSSGSCAGTYVPGGRGLYGVNHQCDTVGGNSGSSLMGSDGWSHGVHFGASNSFSYNVGTILRGQRWCDIMIGSGRVATCIPCTAATGRCTSSATCCSGLSCNSGRCTSAPPPFVCNKNRKCPKGKRCVRGQCKKTCKKRGRCQNSAQCCGRRNRCVRKRCRNL